MFRYCESFLTINVEFNPQNVQDMYDLFSRCSKLISIKLPNFKTTSTGKAINSYTQSETESAENFVDEEG